MKLFLVASAICLIVLIGQTSALRISQSESASGRASGHLRLKIHQTETIREEEPSCSCKKGNNVVIKTPERKEKVFVNRSKPVYVTGKSRRVVIPASEPIVVKPAPVVIRQKGDVEVRPIHITKQPPPLIVTKKIVKLHQPIVKKYYVEQYRKHEEGCPAHIISEKVSKKTCNCPTSQHVVSPKYTYVDDDSAPLIEKEDGGDDKFSQSIKVLQGGNDEVESEFDFEGADS